MTRELVENRLHGHRALRELGEIPTLEMLGDPVVESPKRTALELVMARSLKLLDRLVNVTRWKRLGIYEVNDHISRVCFCDLDALVSVDPLAHVGPVRNNARNCGGQHARQVCHDVLSVTASELHIRREAKILANHHLVADTHGSRKGLVMRVTQTKDKATIICLDVVTLQGEPAKVTKAATRKRVFFLLDLKTSAFKCRVCLIDKRKVWDWSVGIRAIGRSFHTSVIQDQTRIRVSLCKLLASHNILSHD